MHCVTANRFSYLQCSAAMSAEGTNAATWNGNLCQAHTEYVQLQGASAGPAHATSKLAVVTRQVTLLLPWLALSDQRRLFPDGLAFASPDAQEAWVRCLYCVWPVYLEACASGCGARTCLLTTGVTVKDTGDQSLDNHPSTPSSCCLLLASIPQNTDEHSHTEARLLYAQVRTWVHERAGFDAAFDITWYPGRYDNAFRSIFAVGDVTQYVPDSEARRAFAMSAAVARWSQERACISVAVKLLLLVADMDAQRSCSRKA